MNTDASLSELTSCDGQPKATHSEMTDFYANKNVMVTGGSGFLGKVIIWKLLKSCPDINKIYVLIRCKAGQAPEKRLSMMLKSKPFTMLDKSFDQLMNIVLAVEADMTTPGLGLMDSDLKMIQENVHIVIHSAASVKFDAPLKENLRDNVYGTRSIVKICDGIKNLKALVHVSTAYSNCHSKEIREQLLPLKTKAEEAIKLIESLPDDVSESVTDTMLEGRPNTYTYTKAIAEEIVSSVAGKFPVCIVRPSIVIPSSSEPCPGWIDNVNGIAGLGCLAAVGLLRTIDWNYYGTSDMVPVDMVANIIISAAFETSRSPTYKGLKIYNMTSGNLSPITWGKYFDISRREAAIRPSVKIVRPMIQAPRYNRVNKVEFFATRVFSELLFAYFVDFLLSMIGYKKVVLKITKKMHHGYKILLPFTTGSWLFASENVVSLSDSLSDSDKETFKFDMRGFDWDKQGLNSWLGAREHLLKEESTEESFNTAKSRMLLVTVVHYTFLVLMIGGLLIASGYSASRLLRSF